MAAIVEQYSHIAKSACGSHASLSEDGLNRDLLSAAAAATDTEHNTGFWRSMRLYKKACFWSIFLSTCIVMEGFDCVLLNALFAYPPFQKRYGVELPDGTFEIKAVWQTWISNSTAFGQILGLLINGIVAEKFGYRKTLISSLAACACFVFVVFFAESLAQILVGQFLMGIPWGVFQTITTTYASEVCPTHLRAYLTTYVNICWVIGQLLAVAALRAMLTRDDKWGYKIPLGLQWMWPVPLAVGIFFAPESPWWLVRCGRVEDAKISLRRLTTTRNDGIDETISMMIHTNQIEEKVVSGTSYIDLFRGKVNRRRLEIVCVTWMIQQLSGCSLMGFATYFFQKAGLSTEDSFNMSLGLYSMGIVGTILSWVLMGRIGRRTLYLHGLIALFFTQLFIGCVAFAGRENIAAQWSIGSFLLVFNFVYDATIGSVCFSLVTELSSTRLRAKSVVAARCSYIVVCIITNLLTPNMLNISAWNWGAKAGLFWAGSCLLCSIWVYFRLPEPAGRTYAELNVLFENNVSARKFSSTKVARFDEDGDGGLAKEQ